MEKWRVNGLKHEISSGAKWNIFNSVTGQSLATVFIKLPKMKLIAGVILLRSLWQRQNFISNDIMLCNYYPEMKSCERTHLSIGLFHKNKDGNYGNVLFKLLLWYANCNRKCLLSKTHTHTHTHTHTEYKFVQL